LEQTYREDEGFFCKRSLLLLGAVLVSAPQSQRRKSFCAAFFKKRLLPRL
jgi:hypothetical protein